ncbi:hypothetical protein KAR91_85305 [Candidatus Pacearchaeota archaeon]|nr:hypothetical protein [Candidatus Pacearchaeota archaeon]
MSIELEAIGVAIGGGLSGSSILILFIKLLERRVTRNEKAISAATQRHYKDLADTKEEFQAKIDEQEDCWEEEIGKVSDAVGEVNDNVQRVITVMQMQAMSEDKPELVDILKGGT